MKTLRDLLYGVSIEAIQGNTLIEVEAIAFDSRQVKKRGLFIAIKGDQIDGHEYMNAAIEKGASAIICEQKPAIADSTIVWITTKNSREALAFCAANFYDNPSQELSLVGVTGTNGKTSVTSLLHHLFESAGYAVGLLSTIVVKYPSRTIEATHTTPDPLQINQHLRAMVSQGVEHCFMEVSSHGIAQDRIKGLVFSGGVFTNLTQDHLDYHETFAAYRDVKKAFFDGLSPKAFSLINVDDKNGNYMHQNCKAQCKSFALKNYATYQAKVLETEFSGMLLKIDNQEVWTSLVGQFNASNLLAVYAVARELNMGKMEVLAALSELRNVKGRFDTFITPNKATVIVDYAHTPDALKNVLETIALIRTKNETLTTIIGCGGDRDQTKRPLMAKAAAALSDKVIFTSDNPRNEDPESIIDQMEAGVSPSDYKKSLRITNRKAAIKAGCMSLTPGDVLLVAGKGHENYQEIKGEKHPFDDYALVKEICKQLF